MKYYKYLKEYIKDSALKQGIIYPFNFVDKDISGNSCLTVEFYVVNCEYFNQHGYWQEVTEREYWQQELEAGKLVIGGYYTVKKTGVIFKYDGTPKSEYYIGISLKSHNKELDKFWRDNGNFDSDNVINDYRLATEDEIEWLEACNKADRFISKEEFMKSKKFVLPKQWHIKLKSQKEFDEFLKWAVTNRYLSDVHLDYKSYIFPYYCGLDLNYGWYNYKLNRDYSEEITFEQFKQYVLKENMKDRKVDYYKLIKPEFTKAAEVIMETSFSYTEDVGIVKVPSCIEKLKKAGVLDLWFEPVYESELKVGDWITFNNGETVKITDISPDCYAGQWIKHEGQAFTGGGFRWGGNGYFLGKDFRLATPEEIKQATTIKIKGYKAKIDAQGGKVNIGCKSFTYGNVRGVVAAIEAGLKVENADQILKLWDKIK